MNPSTDPKEPLDIREQGMGPGGAPVRLDRRLYCQLRVYTGVGDPTALAAELKKGRLPGVIYRDVNDPRGVGVLLMGEEQELFSEETAGLFRSEPFSGLSPRPEMTMLGRTYSTGREEDLQDWMLVRPKRYALDPAWPWAVWYPLRRKPEFELLEGREKGRIMMEHGMIGRSFGEAGLARDIRLACHGLGGQDNDFLLGLIGKELYPLSRLVQEMRKTQQTAKYLDALGPFFVGKVLASWTGTGS